MSAQMTPGVRNLNKMRATNSGQKVERKQPFRVTRPVPKRNVIVTAKSVDVKSIPSNSENSGNKGQNASEKDGISSFRNHKVDNVFNDNKSLAKISIENAKVDLDNKQYERGTTKEQVVCKTSGTSPCRNDKVDKRKNNIKSFLKTSNDSFITDFDSEVEGEEDVEIDPDELIYEELKKPKPAVKPKSPEHLDTILKVYEIACRKYNSVPSKAIKSGLHSQTLACKFRQLQKGEVAAICVAIAENPFVEELDFENNNIGPEGAKMFAEVIRASCYLTHIRMAENNLGHEGAMAICEAVRHNNKILFLDLSGNGFLEGDGQYFQRMIEESDSLREVHLGNNNLMENGIKAIAHALDDSCNIRVLDLHWNNIRLKGAVAIGDAMRNNSSVEKLDLSWNGLSLDGAKAMSKALEKNDTLLELDLTNNRLTEECFGELAKGLQKNETLRVLRIGGNHMSSAGAMSILRLIVDNLNSQLTLVDFGNQNVHDDFETFTEELRENRNMKVLHGPVWKSQRKSIASTDVDENELEILQNNPLLVLMECIRLLNYRLLDFFHFADTDKNKLICIDELCDCMLKMNVPLQRHTMLKLFRAMDTDGSNTLDFTELVEAQANHRKQVRQFLKEDIDFDETDIGKISILLMNILGKDFTRSKSDCILTGHVTTKGKSSKTINKDKSKGKRDLPFKSK